MKKWKIILTCLLIEAVCCLIIGAIIIALAHACGFYFENLSVTGAFWCGVASLFGIELVEGIIREVLPDQFRKVLGKAVVKIELETEEKSEA